MRIAPVLDRAARAYADLALVAGVGVAYATLGYGNDNDTYHMLDTFRQLVDGGMYHASRGTGYPLAEVIIGSLAQLGGSLLSNLASVVLSLVVLVLLRRWVQSFGRPPAFAALAVLAVGLQPVWLIASATSMDYLYALAPFAGAVAALAVGQVWWSAPLMALAIAGRITYAPLVIAVYAIAIWTRRASIGPAVLAIVGGGLAYVPAWLVAGGGTAFLVVHENAPFSVPRALGNATLRHLDFWGLPAMLVLVAAAWTWRRRDAPRDRLVPAVLLLTAAWFELLFLRLPAEPAYLLPALPAAIGLLAWGHARSRWLVAMLLVGVLHGAVQIALLRPPEARHVVPVVTLGSVSLRSEGGAPGTIGLFLEPGPLVADIERRQTAQAQWVGWLHRTYPDHRD